MRRFSIVALALALTAAACGGNGGEEADVDGSPSTSAVATTVPVPSTAPGTTLAATSLTLRITDLRLVNSEESDSGVRILLPAGVPNAAVTLTGAPSPNRVVSVCQARELDRRLPAAACRTPQNGESVTLPLGTAATGVEIVQVGVTGSGPSGNTATLDEVAIRYTSSSREINVRLSQIAAGDSGGRPTFGLTPASPDGSYRAALSWSVIPVFGGSPSNGQLELVTGGNVANQAQSTAADVRLSGNVPGGATDPAIRVQNIGSSALVTPKLTATLP